jgi:hypothetical protein
MPPTALSPTALLAIRKLVLCRNYRQIVSDAQFEQKYGKHAIENPDRRMTFSASA